MDELRAELVGEIKGEMGLKADQGFPYELQVPVRDRLALLIESREDVCSRDAIRIAHAWATGKPTPENWRRR